MKDPANYLTLEELIKYYQDKKDQNNPIHYIIRNGEIVKIEEGE